MDSLFITDNNIFYEKAKAEFKIHVKNGLIISSSFLSAEEIQNFNADLNSNEVKATQLMLDEIKQREKELQDVNFKTNRYLSKNNKSDPTFYYLFYNYHSFVEPCYVLALFLEKFEQQFEKITAITFNLSDEFKYIEKVAPRFIKCKNLIYKFRTNKHLLYRKWILNIKKIFYFTTGIFNKYFFHKNLFPKTDKKRLLLVLYNIAHQHEMLKELLKKIDDKKDIDINVVHLSWGGDKDHAKSLNATLKTKFLTYYIWKFRSFNFIDHTDFYKSMAHLEETFSVFKKYNVLSNPDVLYSWIGQMFSLAKPDVCLHVGVSDVGRIITDVARYFKVPSINLEYGLACEDPSMSTRIKFTVRACLGLNSANLWKKYNDPSEYIIPIGFTKLDKAQDKIKMYDKAKVFKKHNLDLNKKTVFFASTYAMETNKQYDFEKQNLVIHLSQLCNKYSWNLLIKKHPLEFDNFLREILKKNNYPNQVVLEHSEIEILEAAYYSDLITNQMSSIVIEALFLNKPVCYLTNSKNKSLAEYMTPVILGEIPRFTNMNDFEKYVVSLFSDETFNQEVKNKLNSIREKYIYKSDGLASERLMKIIQLLLNGKTDFLKEIE